MKEFPFIKYSSIYYFIFIIVIGVSIFSLIFFGLKWGIEFTGGSKIEIEFLEKSPSVEEVRKILEDLNFEIVNLYSVGEKEMVLIGGEINEELNQKILSKLNESFALQQKSFQYLGPSVGRELRNKSQLAVLVALIAINLYIAFAFRKVSRPVHSWKYGVISLIALFHDVIVSLGALSLLGRFYNVEVTVPIIAGLLVVLGFSVHDTIIIFDRIRENLLRYEKVEFEDIVNQSLNQTLGRSLTTVLTTLFPLFTIYFWGGETLKYFSLILIIGIIAGSYSSIFIAAPLLVTWYRFSQQRQKR